MYILGLSAYYHDSAAALIKDGCIIAAAQEERFSRIKNDAAFPLKAVEFCLACANITLAEVACVVFYDKPFLKFERILENFYNHAPRGFSQFVRCMPVWIKEKMFFKQMLRKELKQVAGYSSSRFRLLFAEHHLSHAASAFFASPYKEAAILTVDGVGEWCTLSIALGRENGISMLREMHFPHSVGLLYSSFTYYLGFKVNSGEYKLMGLAPYGDREAEETRRYANLIEEHLVTIYPDGSIRLNLSLFRFHTGMTMVNEKRWEALFGFPRRQPETPLLPAHCHLACAAQLVTEEIILRLTAEARRLTQTPALCLAGGVALNCVANRQIIEQGAFPSVFVQPAAGDAGGALGAAWAAYYIYLRQPRVYGAPDAMQGALLGPAYPDACLRSFARRSNLPFREARTADELCRLTAALLAEGNCVGWFQGRMEFGPRALGNRSILADPRHPDMQQRVNLKIKYRESFRPFAPAILEEDAPRYFDCPATSPYMLLTAGIREAYRKELPPGYSRFSIQEKLAVAKSAFPSVTHVDYSSRLQTVDGKANPLFRRLLSAYKELTGCPMLINTSFNVRGEPIVCSPADAVRCFMATEMDYLVMGNLIFDKQQCTQLYGISERPVHVPAGT